MSHLKTSFSYIRRSPFQAIAAIFSLSLTFFVATLVVLTIYGSSRALNYFETRPQVIAFIKNDAKPEVVSNLQKKLIDDPRVKDVRYVSKEDALAIYKSGTADNPLLGELVSPSTLPASLEFSVKDLEFTQKVIEETKGEEAVDSIGFTASVGKESSLGDAVDRLRKISFYVKVVGLSFMGVLGLTSLLVLTVVISMRITTRRGEIETLSLIGAKPGFIRMPIILESLNYAIVGSMLGFAIATIIVLYVTPSILTFFGAIPVIPREPLELAKLLGIILIGEVFVSIIIAMIGSSIATGRALSQKR